MKEAYGTEDKENKHFWEKVACFLTGAVLIGGWGLYVGVMQSPWCDVPPTYDFCVQGNKVFSNQNEHQLKDARYTKGMTLYGEEKFAQGKSEGQAEGFEEGFNLGFFQIKLLNSHLFFDRADWLVKFKCEMEDLNEGKGGNSKHCLLNSSPLPGLE